MKQKHYPIIANRFELIAQACKSVFDKIMRTLMCINLTDGVLLGFVYEL